MISKTRKGEIHSQPFVSYNWNTRLIVDFVCIIEKLKVYKHIICSKLNLWTVVVFSINDVPYITKWLYESMVLAQICPLDTKIFPQTQIWRCHRS